MGEAASLGAVILGGFVLYKLTGLKMPKLELPKLPELPVFPSPGPQGSLSGRDRTQTTGGDQDLGNTGGGGRDPWIPPIVPPPLPDAPPKPDIQGVDYYTGKLDYHRARVTYYRDVSDELVPRITDQLAALQQASADLSAAIKPGDAGGSTSIGMTGGGGRRR